MTPLATLPTIRGFGSFQNFQWTTSATGLCFTDLNFIFGPNYSGKTTLSKILQSLEHKRLPEHYDGAKFELCFADGTVLTQDQVASSPSPVRVFNRDFVSDNLAFLRDTRQDNQHIAPFAVLGHGNKALEDQIKAVSDTLGIENGEKSTGLYAEQCQYYKMLRENQEKQEIVSHLIMQIKGQIQTNLTTDIQKHFNLPTYNVIKLYKDIEAVSAKSYHDLSEREVFTKIAITRDTVRSPVPQTDFPPVKLREILLKAGQLLKRKVFQGKAIAEFLNDAARENWAREGFNLHKENHAVCAFCGQPMPDKRWQNIRAHFESECENLRKEIEDLLRVIGAELDATDSWLRIDPDDFYAALRDEAKSVRSDLDGALATYRATLKNVRVLLQKRLKAIATPRLKPMPVDPSPQLGAAWSAFLELAVRNNNYAAELSRDQTEAYESLRLHAVAQVLKAHKLPTKIDELNRLKDVRDKLAEPLHAVRAKIDGLRAKLAELRRMRHDETRAAELINNYLTWNGEGNTLRLQIEQIVEDGVTSKVFRILRDGAPAYNLSEGECNLIAFCYFLATLSGPSLEHDKPIVWIDDPISSLDLNHIYFVYALIRGVILNGKKCGQLFVSTHNLEFLRYMRRMAGWKANDKTVGSAWFFVRRSPEGSVVEPLPKYLRNYQTEFVHLFTQIYNAAETEPNDPNYDKLINGFGNAARRFLEIYLYFKFPNDIGEKGEHTRRMTDFLGGEVTALFVDRVINDLSHESGAFERAMTPVAPAEVHQVAVEILMRVKNADPIQYENLLKAINKDDLIGNDTLS